MKRINHNRTVLVKGQSTSAIFVQDTARSYLIRLGNNARFEIAQLESDLWVAQSMNINRHAVIGKDAFQAYCKFVRRFLKTSPKTGRAVA